MKTIYEFNKGDEIVRVQPAKPYSPTRMGFFGEEGGVRDRSYIGNKMVFVGIANGKIYLKRLDDFSLKIFGDKLLELDLDIFDEGWDFYVDPKTLVEGFETIIDKITIEEQIEKAVEEENYELAEKLRLKLKNK